MQYSRSYHDGSPFHRFYTYQPDIFSGSKKTDYLAQDVVHQLFDVDICPKPDSWARYLLLIVWLWQVPATSSFRHLEIVIQGIRTFQADGNIYLLSIHRHILAQQTRSEVQRFFSNPLPQAQRLLIIYLLKTCVDVSRSWFADPEQGYSVASNAASHINRLLSKFDFGHPKTTICAYAKLRIADRVKQARLKQENNGRRPRSDYARIRYISKRQLRQVLKNFGTAKDMIQRCALVAQSFKEIYTTQQDGRGALPPPTLEQFNRICDRCNQRRQSLGISNTFSLDEVQSTLKQIIKLLKDEDKRYRKPDSLDALLSDESGEKKAREPSELVTEEVPIDLIADALSIEDCRAYLQRLESKVIEAFEQLPSSGQQSLRLHYGLQLVTKDVGIIIQKNQSTAYRNIQANKARIKKSCADDCLQFIQEKYANMLQELQSLNSVIACLTEQVDVYLLESIQRSRHTLVMHALESIESSDRHRVWSDASFANQSKVDCQSTTYTTVLRAFVNAVREQWGVDLTNYSELDGHLRKFLCQWLNDAIRFLSEEK